MPGFYTWDGADLILSVRVQPRASHNELSTVSANAIKVRLTAPPVDGKANTALKKLLAKAFGVAPSTIELLSGESSRDKRLLIPSPSRLPGNIKEQQPAGR
jgi:uncharacterized protein (TIGR00251 family)